MLTRRREIRSSKCFRRSKSDGPGRGSEFILHLTTAAADSAAVNGATIFARPPHSARQRGIHVRERAHFITGERIFPALYSAPRLSAEELARCVRASFLDYFQQVEAELALPESRELCCPIWLTENEAHDVSPV